MSALPRSRDAASAASTAASLLTELDLQGVTPLSLAGELAASAEENKLLCLLADGRLLVAGGQSMNPHVLSYCARLDRLKFSYQPVPASFELISRLAQGSSLNSGGPRLDHTKMQVTAKDWLQRACHERASDIHIRVRRTGTEIHFRIHNDLVRVFSHTREYGERLVATMYAAMTTVSDNAYKPNERQDASIGDRDKLPERLYGVRIATAPTNEGNVMVLRLLYNDAGDDLALQNLGFSIQQAAQIHRLQAQPIGMNIISGPTGSGKSTTLQRVLMGQLTDCNGSRHVITVEDPIEYPIPMAVQTPVTNARTEDERARAFAAAISNAMRLDPDTIMIGEVRDGASAQNALRAAMTGHQVWTTVHANSAIAVIDRLVDLGLPIAMVADHTVTTGLIAQRLIKVLCPDCRHMLAREERSLPEDLVRRVRCVAGTAYERVHVAGPGCDRCRGYGTIGRTVVSEVIVPDAEFFELLRNGHKVQAHRYWINEMQGRTLMDHAVDKVTTGLVDPRMAEQVVGSLERSVGASERRLSVVETTHAL
jgi:type II secretory ATPase GspE/PulE/Tfp pilus assembly ATPase PilB-like protein